MVGSIIGSVIWKNTCTRLAPRSIAASSRSTGISRKKLSIIQTTSDTLKAE